MSEATSSQSPSASSGRLPRNARKKNFDLTLPLSPFQDANCAAHSSPLAHNERGDPEPVSFFEDWDDPPTTTVVKEEDTVQNPVIMPNTPSPTADSNCNAPLLKSASDETLNTSPKTPLLVLKEVIHTKNSPKSTQLSIDTTCKPSTLASPPSLSSKPAVPSNCDHSPDNFSPGDNCIPEKDI